MQVKARRNRRGEVIVEAIKLEGGLEVLVRLNKVTGVFSASYEEAFPTSNGTHCDREFWEGRDLAQLREDIEEWARTKKSLVWEPVIVVGQKSSFGLGEGQRLLGHVFLRMMRARMHTGKDYVWRRWAQTKPAPKDSLGGSFLYDHDLEVYPPSSSAVAPSAGLSGLEPAVIDYTPERWVALLKLREMETSLQNKLKNIIKGGADELEKMLLKVPATGLLGLIE